VLADSVRRSNPVIVALTLALALAAAGCGGDDEAAQPTDEAAAPPATTSADDSSAAAPAEDLVALARRPEGEAGLRAAAQRARIVAEESEFGSVLFDANGQVVYVFEIDGADLSNCTSAECVQAWPPVLTEDEPSAGAGIEADLLGTIRRDDGTLQVTYDGRPLYFYEHEGPGEIKCHDVDLHGGLWWVVTPAGDPVA
jgi:predicted lipoprotein with Yx(FWY)xxD motif